MIPDKLLTAAGAELDHYVLGMFGWRRGLEESDATLRARAIARYNLRFGRQMQHDVFTGLTFSTTPPEAQPTAESIRNDMVRDRKERLDAAAFPVWLQLIGQAELLEAPPEQLQHAFKYIAGTAYGLAEAFIAESDKHDGKPKTN